MRISASVLRRCASPSPSSFDRRCAVGHEAVVERDLRGRQRPDAHLVDLAADDEALEAALDQEDGQLLLLAGAGEHREEVGHRRGGDPGLLAVQHIAAVDLLRRGGDAFEVGAGIRLGHADRADLLAAQRRLEQALDDVGVAQHVQELGPHQRLHRRRAGQRHRAARDLLQRERELGQAQRRSRRRPPGSAGRRSRAPRAGSISARG